MQNNFYVYEWFNIDTQEVFYVGKGTGNRYKNKQKRNKYFIEYINTHNVDVRIVKYFQEEQEAFEYEKQLTNSYRAKGMCKCNLIDGGYGGYSKVWTPEMKEYMSLYNPMKDSKQRERMKVQNPMFDKEIALKSGAKHKRPIIINNKYFEGLIDAANYYKVAGNTILNWCKRGYNKDKEPCRYVNEEQKDFKIKSTNSKAIIIDDEYIFESLRQAASEFFKVKDTSPLCKALKQNKLYKNHKVKYVNQQPS